MKIDDGPIVPGVGIGNIKLDITREQLLNIIGSDFKERFRENDSVIEVENARFWIAEDNCLDQIGVQKDFTGKYKKYIGIGSTLQDIKNYIGEYIQVYDTYELEQEKGICFELEDVDDWNELTAPIEFIYVFRIAKH
ncbi:hypothetical protein ADH76_29875 [Enterocloster clostridioformis]|uniref:hypothetical protein n=1 Tax=Enterocloster clostridioformis TaxID=1531 RepID=UPI00080C981A|nr:hypothetical protein [Enterocloster clostridioformis]ANU46960.1 hypothetical protein A4V08_15235 [Lachnoclostridium sp. YL32]NDO32527.1 hypothetical protein [Enterocloster clostridioformis]OXE62803.1 hypothetical protein ADH76_29875 [Enterocloster clostridioformis]QQQ98329.1 hypothetical protein I5Q83_19360 [Enterocloster clostridioformis]